MAIDPGARRRWREHRIGDVPIASGRGVAALALIGIAVLLAISNPIIVTIQSLRGEPLGTETITTELLIINFVFNAIILILLPVAGLAIARPAKRREAGVPHAAPVLAAPTMPSWTQVDEHGRPLRAPGPAVRAPASRAEASGPMTPVATEEVSTGRAVIERLGLQVDRRTPLWILIGIGAAIGSIFALGAILFGLVELGMPEPEESPLIGEIDALLTWPLVFFIPLMAATTEEIFFRGVLQPRIGLIASSFFFGIVHIGYGTWLQVVAPFFLGLLFGFLFLRTRSLWAAIAAHYTFDFVQLVGLMVTK